MSRIRLRAKALVAAVLLTVTAVGFVAPVSASASAAPASRAILRAIL